MLPDYKSVPIVPFLANDPLLPIVPYQSK
jgi:hypothetical protein